jgi:hypothetical protein
MGTADPNPAGLTRSPQEGSTRAPHCRHTPGVPPVSPPAGMLLRNFAVIGTAFLRRCAANVSRGREERTSPKTQLRYLSDLTWRLVKCIGETARSRSAAPSAVMSRCGMPSISKPTMNFFTVAERSSGG